LSEIDIVKPKIWDKKWRVVIFDIPEEKRHRRDLLRRKLQELNFIQIQKSVYVYPFECNNEISMISDLLYLTPYVTIMISEIIQGEQAILKQFLDKEVLLNRDLKKSIKK
jgi:CRISPR-associated endonuclease Cas2